MIDQDTLVQLVQQWGHATSIALLDPSCLYFSVPHCKGIIGYRCTTGCAIVFGDPVCALEDRRQLIHAFRDHCVSHNIKSIIYVVATEQFAHWSLQQNVCGCLFAIGNEVILNPHSDPKAGTGPDARRLRNKYIFSQRQGMTIHEYSGNDPELEKKLTTIKEAWLKNRKGLQMGIFGTIDLFAHRANKRYFYVIYKNNIVGLLMLNRLDAHNGWVINMLMRIPDAPTTTSEFLIMSVLDILRQENCALLSVGAVPGPVLGKMIGFNSFYEWLIRKAYAASSKIFKLYGKQNYWKKFNAQTAPMFVVVSRSKFGLREAIGMLRVFNV